MLAPGFIILIFLVSLVGLVLPLHGTDDVVRRVLVCVKDLEGSVWRGSVDQVVKGPKGLKGLWDTGRRQLPFKDYLGALSRHA